MENESCDGGPKKGLVSNYNKYAILFHEEPPALLVGALGVGSQGEVVLVQSTPGGKLYARRAPLHPEPKYDNELPKEIRLHPRHEYTANLVYFEKYASPTHSDFMYGVSVWDFCNADTLAKLHERVYTLKFHQPRLRKKIPEPFILSVFNCLLETLIYMSTTPPCVTHGDLHEENVMLTWMEDANNLFPEARLIDFGFAQVWPGEPFNIQPWGTYSLGSLPPIFDSMVDNWYWHNRHIDHSQACYMVARLAAARSHKEMDGEDIFDTIKLGVKLDHGVWGHSAELIKLIYDYYQAICRSDCEETPWVSRHKPFLSRAKALRAKVHTMLESSLSTYKFNPAIDFDMHELAPNSTPSKRAPALWHNIDDVRTFYKRPPLTRRVSAPEREFDSIAGLSPNRMRYSSSPEYTFSPRETDADVEVTLPDGRTSVGLVSNQCVIAQVEEIAPCKYAVLRTFPWFTDSDNHDDATLDETLVARAPIGTHMTGKRPRKRVNSA